MHKYEKLLNIIQFIDIGYILMHILIKNIIVLEDIHLLYYYSILILI